MGITKIPNTSRVILNMQITDKAEVIEELINLLRKDDATDCWETFIKDVWQCEAEGPTGFENHIAVSHGKSSATINTTLVTGRIHQDIPWETLDGDSARCTILFAARFEDQSTTHTRLSSQVAGVPVDDDIIGQLLVETSPQRIIDLSSQYAQSDVC